MPELDEIDLRPEPEETPIPGPPESRLSWVAAGVALVVVVAAGVGYLVYRGPHAPATTPVAAAPSSAPTPIPGPEAVGLPPLDQSDAFVREQAQGLSPHPMLGLWLGQQGLVRLFVNVVETVSKGESPRASLAFLAPKGPFESVPRKGRLVIGERSYARYDFFAEGVASLDPPACARLLRRSLPLLEAAYRELGYPQGGFERALRDAAGQLLAVPALADDVAVKAVRRGTVIVYEYDDPALESLSPAQKHLLRMGPINVQRVQGTLRGFVTALGS